MAPWEEGEELHDILGEGIYLKREETICVSNLQNTLALL